MPEITAKSRSARRTARTEAGASGPIAVPAFTATPDATVRLITGPDLATGWQNNPA